MTDAASQLTLMPPPAPGRARKQAPATKAPQESAPSLPIARVAVDMSLAHLDRLFDYTVPLAFHDTAIPGCRVKVRFAGKLVDGFLIERVHSSDHMGKLGFVAKVVSDEPVLSLEVSATARAVADRYAGTLADVLRLAVPPRHARTEKAESASSPPAGNEQLPDVDFTVWTRYQHGIAFVEQLVAGRSPRVCWSALPGADPAIAVANAALAMLHAGKGSIICVPDASDVQSFDRAFHDVLGAGRHVVLTAAQGPAERYRSFLALSRGDSRIVVGTRAAAFSPVSNLGLVAIFDDGDDLFAEPRAPYPHAREVLLTRALHNDHAVLVGGYARSAEAQMLVETHWCQEVMATQATRRSSWPLVQVTDGAEGANAPARLPHSAFTLIRRSLGSGPVLIQVPRRGYRASLACQQCREPARCRTCAGPLIQPSAAAPLHCRWCGESAHRWSCAGCGATSLRAPVVGQLRTAEEIGKAFHGATVITSGGDKMVATVDSSPAIVLATPGAEPRADGGYSAAVLLDTWLQLGRPDMRVGEEAHRRWFNALALVRPSSEGGKAIVIGDPGTLQALVRCDPTGFAARELAQRRQAHLPPATSLATLEAPSSVLDALKDTQWPEPSEVMGPVPLDEERSRLIVRAPRSRGGQLAATLAAMQAQRSAAKQTPVRVCVDPYAL